MGHIGLTPQTISKLGGFKVQGTDIATARKLLEDARAIEAAGAFMLTLECVPDRLAELITKELDIPTSGIGAGPHTDGQSLILYDILGLFERFTPKFVKKYVNLSENVSLALQQYKEEVEQGIFPGPEHSFHIKDEVWKEVSEDNG